MICTDTYYACIHKYATCYIQTFSYNMYSYYDIIYMVLFYSIRSEVQQTKAPLYTTKKCVRNIEGVNLRFHTEGLFKKYEILKLEDLFTLQTNSFMYKFINSKCPSSFNNFFVPFRGENRSKSFIIDILKSQKLEHFPSFFMPKVWNNICIEMKRQFAEITEVKLLTTNTF